MWLLFATLLNKSLRWMHDRLAIAAAFGFIDDRWQIRARWQFVFQVALALFAIALGLQILEINNPLEFLGGVFSDDTLVFEGVLAALDARMQEVYWGAFRCDDNGLVDPLGGEAVCAPQRVRVPTPGHWVGAGSGWASYGEVLVTQCRMESADIYPDQKPHAADVARLAAESFRLGNAVSAEQAVPVYLRDNVAVHPGQKA